MPVAVAPDDRDVDAPAVEFGAQGGYERAIARIDRAHSPEGKVVPGDLLQAGLGYRSAVGYAPQKREDVVRPFRPAE